MSSIGIVIGSNINASGYVKKWCASLTGKMRDSSKGRMLYVVDEKDGIQKQLNLATFTGETLAEYNGKVYNRVYESGKLIKEVIQA